MPETRWSDDTIGWLTARLQKLGEAKPTMPWVRDIMDDFYKACGKDPVIGTSGFSTKSEVLLASIILSILYLRWLTHRST